MTPTVAEGEPGKAASLLSHTVVLDASVTLGVFFEDEQDDYSVAVWRSLEHVHALVPSLWHLELGNILARAVRIGRIDEAAVEASWRRLVALGVQTVAHARDASHWAARARRWGLTAYDACYLDLALLNDLPLATKDAALAAAARRQGVTIHLQDPRDLRGRPTEP